ncbi:MAG: hypothetical protein K5639_04455, partial [Eubacterium sp.]|nr:hypothetical protein [Eubacterium sp.]
MASVEICGNNFADKTGALAVVKGNISNIELEDGGTIGIEVPDRSNRSIKVSGHITDSAGEAATGQSVTLEKQLLYHTDAGNNEKWFKYDEETTDDNGNYSIPAENNNVYRISVGKDVPVHSGSVWARDNDENIDLSVTLHSLQGKVSTESGKAAEGIYVAIKRVGGINAYGENAATTSGQPVSTSDTEDEIETESDPVREANFNDQMVSIQSDKNGLFTFSEVCDGAYEVIVGRTGKLSSQIVVMGDSFVNVPVTDEDAKVEKYRNQILEDKERSNDYATELDLPGYLIPTPSPTPRAEEMAKPDLKGKLLFDGETVYTKYNYTIEDYAHRQYANVPRIPEKKYLELLDPTKDQTKGMQFLRVDEYRPVNEKEYIKQFQSMIESFCRASGKSPQSSSLYGHGMDMIKAAKKNKIDLIFMTVQTFLESAYGSRHVASGNKITKVALPGYPRTGGGKFLTKSLKKPVKVYNLYGIKAVDSDPYVG